MEIAVVLAVIVIAGAIVYMLDRRTKQKGALFSGTRTPTMRILASLLAVIFGGIFVSELSSAGSVHCVFPVLCVAASGYALGAIGLLRTLQQGDAESSEDELE